MILVDSRVGSNDLVARLPTGKSKLELLNAGDVAFLGYGPDGTQMSIGIEIKTVSDALDSFSNGRFSGQQLPKLRADYQRVYFLIEGVWGFDTEGRIRLGKFIERGSKGDRLWVWYRTTGVSYQQFDNYLSSLQEFHGVRVKRSCDRSETVTQIWDLYKWWQKPYEEHNSTKHFFDDSDYLVPFRAPTLEEKIAKQLPGIGREKATLVAEHFGNVYNMVVAEEQQWLQIPSIGPKTAKKIMTALRRIT